MTYYPLAGTTPLVDAAAGFTGVSASPARADHSHPAIISCSTQTASYTAALTDAGTAIDMNSSSAVTFTVPENGTVAFPIGTVIEICQFGAGQVTLAPATGVTLYTASSLTTRAQYSCVSIRQRSTDIWIISGDMT